jgi:hypothetical protein
VASANEQGVEVERLDLAGELASGSITLSTSFADRRLAGGGRIELELQPAIEWFEPDLETLLQPRGRLKLSGTVEATAGSGVTMALEHVGGPLSAAGYGITRLRLSSTPTGVVLDAGGDEWGSSVDLRATRPWCGAFADAAVCRRRGAEPSWLPGPSPQRAVDARTAAGECSAATAAVDLRYASEGARAQERGLTPRAGCPSASAALRGEGGSRRI